MVRFLPSVELASLPVYGIMSEEVDNASEKLVKQLDCYFTETPDVSDSARK
jgi:hypothetical protein